jgi:cytochrome c oxidase assembly protein Cox11
MTTKKLLVISTVFVIFMFGLSFALAPLYNTFCKLTNIPRLLTEKEFFEKQMRLEPLLYNLLQPIIKILPGIFIH